MKFTQRYLKYRCLDHLANVAKECEKYLFPLPQLDYTREVKVTMMAFKHRANDYLVALPTTKSLRLIGSASGYLHWYYFHRMFQWYERRFKKFFFHSVLWKPEFDLVLERLTSLCEVGRSMDDIQYHMELVCGW